MVDGKKTGWGLLASKKSDIESLTGQWKEGRLEGKGRLVSSVRVMVAVIMKLMLQVTNNTTVLEGWFKQSCLHGLVRRSEMKKFRTFKQQVRPSDLPDLTIV